MIIILIVETDAVMGVTALEITVEVVVVIVEVY